MQPGDRRGIGSTIYWKDLLCSIQSHVIDKTDPELGKRWPTGFMGFFWRVLTVLIAKPPSVAGEPIADLMLSYKDRSAINGA